MRAISFPTTFTTSMARNGQVSVPERMCIAGIFCASEFRNQSFEHLSSAARAAGSNRDWCKWEPFYETGLAANAILSLQNRVAVAFCRRWPCTASSARVFDRKEKDFVNEFEPLVSLTFSKEGRFMISRVIKELATMCSVCDVDFRNSGEGKRI